MIPIILAVIIVLLCLVFLWKRESNTKENENTTIPGPSKDSKEFGNFNPVDMPSQILYLQKLHKRYGPIVRFWQGDEMSVSISAPDMLKETRHLSLCPSTLAEPFRILTDGQSFPFQSPEEILERRKLYDQQLSMKAVKTHFNILKGVAEEFASKWQNGDTIPLLDTLNTAAIKAVLIATFGEAFANDELRASFQKEYEIVSKNIGQALTPEKKEIFLAALKKLKAVIKDAYEIRREQLKNDSDTHILIDVLLEDYIPEAQRDADGLVFFIGSGTINFALIQLLYHLITNPQYQDKIYEELKEVLCEDSIKTLENYQQLTFLRQVIDENLRYKFNLFTARKAEKDMTIAGHFIPKGTPIMQYLGEASQDPTQWKNPTKFDPDNFSRENSKGRHSYAFKPFGFAGKRICPGMNFALMLMITFCAVWLQKFKFTLPPGEAFVFMEMEGFEGIIEKEVQVKVTHR